LSQDLRADPLSFCGKRVCRSPAQGCSSRAL